MAASCVQLSTHQTAKCRWRQWSTREGKNIIENKQNCFYLWYKHTVFQLIVNWSKSSVIDVIKTKLFRKSNYFKTCVIRSTELLSRSNEVTHKQFGCQSLHFSLLWWIYEATHKQFGCHILYFNLHKRNLNSLSSQTETILNNVFFK